MIDNLDNTPEQELPPLPKGYSKIESKNTIPPLPKGYNVVKKKVDTTSTTPPQKLVSETNTGSLGGVKFPKFNIKEYTSKKPIVKQEVNNVVRDNTSVIPKINKQTSIEDLNRQNQKFKELTKKIVSETRQKITVPDEEKQQIKQQVDDIANQTGVVNNLKAFGKKAWNTILDTGTKISTFGEVDKTFDAIRFDEDPLEKEKQESKADLIKKGVKQSDITPEIILQKAKELKTNKLIQDAKQSKINSYMETMSDEHKSYFELDRTQAYKTISQSDKKLLGEYQIQEKNVLDLSEDFKKQKEDYDTAVKNGNITQEQILNTQKAQNKLLSEVESLRSIDKKYRDNYTELGTVEEELDIAKRRYGRGINALGGLGLAIGDLVLDAVSALDYVSTLGGTFDKENSKITAQQLQVGKDAINKERETLRKPIETINNTKDLIDFSTDTIITQIPQLALAYFTGGASTAETVGARVISKELVGASTLASTSLGNEFQKMQMSNIKGKTNYNAFQLALTPLTYFGSELAENIFQIKLLKQSSRAFNSAIADNVGKDLFKKNITQKAIDFGFKPIKNLGKNIGYEELTTIGQNWANINIKGDPNAKYSDNMLETFQATLVTGGVLSFAPHIISSATQMARPKTDNALLDINAKKLIELSVKIKEDLISPESKVILQKEIDDISKQSEAIIKKSISKIKEMPKEVFNKLIDLETQGSNIRAEVDIIVNDKGFTKEEKQGRLNVLKEKYKISETQRNEIISGNVTAFDILPDSQKIKIKDIASRELIKEQNPDGKKSIKLNDEQITERANIIYLKQLKDAEIESTVTEGKPEVEPKAQVQEPTVAEQEKVDLDSLEKAEYEDFVNNNNVSDERLVDIAEKVKSGSKLTSYENAIFTGKTTEINKIIANESISEGNITPNEGVRVGDNAELQQQQVEDIQPSTIVGEGKSDFEYAREQVNQGILEWNGDMFSPRIDLGMTWADIRKGQSDLAKGKENTVPAKRLVEAINKAKEEGGYRYKFGTGGESARATEFVTFEDMQKTKNEYNLTDAEQKEIIDNEAQYAKEYDDYFNSLDEETQNEILDNYENKSTEISGNTTSGESEINVSSKEKSEGKKPKESDSSKREETDIGNNFKRKSGVRSVLKRLRDGGNSDNINSIIDKIGLNYEVSKAEKIYANAYNFIEEVGIFEAYNAIKNGLIPQYDVQTVTYSIILDKMHKTVENELSKITDLDEMNDLVKEFDSFKEKVIFEYVTRATDMGKGNAILNFIYNKNQEINYSLTKQIKSFKSKNSGIVPKDIMDKFIALDKEYREANEKIKELETLLEEAKEQQNFDNIVEDINRKPETSKTKKERAEKIIKALDNFEKSILKNAYSDATLITPILIQGIKATKLAIKQGVNIAEAIEKGIEGIKLELEKLGKSFESENRFRNDLKESLESEGVELKEPKVTVDKNGKVRVPIEMIKDYVSKGGTDLKEFSEELYKLTKEEFPDVSLRDIRESISGYGSKSNKTRNAILDDINKLKLEEKLRIQYEDLQNGISKEKNVIKKRSLSDTEIKIKNQIKALQDDLGITEQERTNRSVNYTKNRIKQLQQKIETKDYSKKEIKPIEESYELKKLKIEKNRIQEDFDYLQHEQELKNRKPKERTIDFLKDVWDSQRATRATGELSFVGAQGGFYMIDKTFSRQTIKNLIKNFKGTTSQDWKSNPVKTMVKIIKSANTADNLIEMIKSMGTANYFNDSQRLLKEDPKYDDKIKAGLRILGEDVKTQVKDDMFIGNVFLNAFKIPIDLIDRVKKKETLENIKNGKLKIESAEKGRKRTTIQGYYEKLKIGEVSDKNKKTATEIFSNANPLSTFERGNSSFMNKARSLYYDEYSAMLEQQGKNIVDHIEDYKKLGSAINTITGSANLNETLTRAIGSLNFLMFSARFFAANLNLTPPISFIYLAKLGNYDGVDLTNPKTLANIRITPAQKMFLKPMLKGMVFSFGASMTLVSIINSAIDDDDEMSEEEKAEKRAYVEYDPRSTDFMQVVSGNSRTDYFGSYRNDFVLLTRLWQRETTKEGEIVSNGSRNKKGGVTESNFQIASKFLANKATPSLGVMVRNSMGKKEDFYNEKTGKVESKVMLFNEDVSFRKQIKDNMLPIYFNTVESILEEDPILGSQLYIMQSAIGKQTSIYGGKKQTMEEDIAEYNNKSALKSLKLKSGSDKIEKNIDKINKQIKEYNMIIYAFENNVPINQKGFKEKEVFTKEQIDKIKLDLEEAKSDLIQEQIELKKNKD